MNLEAWGWTAEWRSRIPDNTSPDLFPARIVFESRSMYRVVAEQGENRATVKGALRKTLAETRRHPAVGDWVLLSAPPGSASWLIEEILPRKSGFSRKSAGTATDEQVIAANCDTVFIVCGLDGGRNFNLRGLERYLTCAWNSGAVPVIILNKADLCDDADGAKLQAESIAPGIDVCVVSCVTRAGFDSLEMHLLPGRTAALIGRSGVGKSSVINVLSGTAGLRTAETRAHDRTGRHTTTHRQLVAIAGGALLLDTPGLRELQLWGEEASLDSSFSDIEALARGCRFADCSHCGEPGCAVQRALDDGGLEPARFESYLDLRRELRFLKNRRDTRARLEEKRKQRAFGRRRKELKNRASRNG